MGAATPTVYIFSGTKVIAEYAAGAAVASPSREYLYSGNQLLATLEGSNTKYHHADHLSLRATTNTSGVVSGTQGHYPFGEEWYAAGDTSKFRFTSYERDLGSGESGNDYAMFRTYVNRLGRFNSPDPIAGSFADPQTLNRYAYVRNDPENLVDPLGLQCTYVTATIGGQPTGPGTISCSLLGGGFDWGVALAEELFGDLPDLFQLGCSAFPDVITSGAGFDFGFFGAIGSTIGLAANGRSGELSLVGSTVGTAGVIAPDAYVFAGATRNAPSNNSLNTRGYPAVGWAFGVGRYGVGWDPSGSVQVTAGPSVSPITAARQQTYTDVLGTVPLLGYVFNWPRAACRAATGR